MTRASDSPPPELTPRSARRRVRTEAQPSVEAYWALPIAALMQRLDASPSGLSRAQVAARRTRFGANTTSEQREVTRLSVLLAQFRSPLILLLVFAAITSLATGGLIDGLVVLTVVTVSAGIGYTREYRAAGAAALLRAQIRTRVRALRDGSEQPVAFEDVVPGDVVSLSAGSLVPADCVVLEANGLQVNQAVLTGESFPVLKTAESVAREASLSERDNCVYAGTNVRSGTGRCLVVHTGRATQVGEVAQRLAQRAPETDFDRGTRRFGYLLTSAMLCIVFAVFAVHLVQGRPTVDTLLFAVALAVGLSPELLPVILNVNLARGAEALAERGVLVRRLSALENLGSMDVLCTDKTGTLTEGVVALAGAYDARGEPSSSVHALGARNAALSTGLDNALDEALTPGVREDMSQKLGELPFDFVRKRASVIVRREQDAELIVKGAVAPLLALCTRDDRGQPLTAAARQELHQRVERWSSEGMRVLAVATRTLTVRALYSVHDEEDLTLAGFLTFSDRAKQGVADSIARLAARGVLVKMVTGDARAVAQHVAREVGLRSSHVLTGRQLAELSTEALCHRVARTDIFAEVDPHQKERVIFALRKIGRVVGFLGDGVNDAPAMHAADVSMSVDQAVDVAREAADLVLMERSLDVIHDGIATGRRTLANTLKYILTTTSANLGNMLSMAVASLVLPFLPLLSSQILLNNFLSDVPAIGIADDDVDPELVARPERWNLHFIGRFMAYFGVLSSLFDLLTFAVLGFLFRAPPEIFRTAWFVESLLTELAVALVVRTRRPFFRSRPGRLLLSATLVLIPVTLAIPYLPPARYLGFVPLPFALVAVILAITATYVLATEQLKRWFYRAGVSRAPQPARAHATLRTP